jgi:transmembrane sensor
MEISNGLVKRFLEGTCTPGEKEQVLAYFRKYPEKMQFYLTDKSWEDFQPDNSIQTPGVKMWEVINRQHRGLYLVYSTGAPAKKNDAAPQQVIAVVTKQEDQDKPRLQRVINEQPVSSSCHLPDGSVVKLKPHSSISFDSLFADKTRDIYLEGEAVFTVKKDKQRPFIVHSKNLTTTALGTVFTVNDRHSAFTVIRLHSGRIVIRKEEHAAGRFNEVFLSPGQQLKVDKGSFTAKLTEMIVHKTVRDTAVKLAPGIMKFSKQPLTEVFSQLQSNYKIIIQYNEEQIRNMDFTGIYDPSKTTVQSFLETLCLLNDLSLTKDVSGDVFTIQVSKQ